jgi:hypothetical protein
VPIGKAGEYACILALIKKRGFPRVAVMARCLL